jgi:uncharacterized protein (TIGR02231 family)
VPVVVALALWPTADAAPAAEQAVSGEVTLVTLYRGQAMVTREIPLAGPRGSMQIVVGDLPEEVLSDSLFAEGGEGVEVRAVRFRSRAVGQEPREEVRKLEEVIEEVNQSLQLNQKKQELLTKKSAYLDQLEGFVAPTAKMELSKGVLNAEALQSVTQFSFDERETIVTEQVALENEAKELNERLSLLQRQLAELTSGASRTVREAVLFLEKQVEGEELVKLSYLVGGCGWSPTYAFRGGEDRDDVLVECSALIHQMTGEDWDRVTLTLSTASPALSSAGPGLAPLHVTLTEAAGDKKLTDADLAVQLQSIQQRQLAANRDQGNAVRWSDNISKSWAVNAAANDFQSLELANGKDVIRAFQLRNVETGDGPSLSYQLEGAVSLASRSDQQMVRILQTGFASRFYHVATPVLTGHVYREAELVNTSSMDLLAGPIAVYLDGRFVGRSEIPTVARGQKFVVGFGADPQLRAQRELADRTEAVQGGNREISFDYRLVIENYKDQPVRLRLFDRLPHSDRSADVRVTVAEKADPLSDDPLYVRRERPKGILRWDVDVPASATGDDAHMVEFGYTVDFAREFQLTAATGGTPQLQREFEELQRARFAQ